MANSSHVPAKSAYRTSLSWSQCSQHPRLTGVIGGETPPLFLITDYRLLFAMVALAEGFEEDHAGGYANVEGFHRAGGGQ